MRVTITYIELKSPLKFFLLSKNALKIVRQLKTTNCNGFKKRGFWTKHYTMTLWNNQEEMESFAKSGAHLEAMKISQSIAKEIRTITIDATSFLSWDKAKELLKEGKRIEF